MSSILTNNGAMVALQTLKSINSGLAQTQSEISTGKRVSSAKDNSAVWAISKVMEADVKGFKGISDSLNLGQSTVAVARQAAETTTELLTDIKGKIVAAQEENVDREKIQTDINALRDQIGAVVGAAQFNGLNLLSNTDNTAGSGSINVLASLDRSGTGVTASDINVAKQDLGTSASSAGTVSVNAGSTNTVATGASGVMATLQEDTAGGITAGNSYEVQAAGSTKLGFSADVAYVARDGDTLADVVTGMVDALNKQAVEDGVDATFAAGTNAGEISVTNNTGTNFAAFAATDVQQSALDGSENDGTIGGRLAGLSDINVTTQDGADAALEEIEGLIQISIDSAANFGSAQGRIETQTDFITGLTDALKSGIGTLVDADMEAASARLQALQVQQQLGVQALSIANQAPQQLLSLFR
ncbi:flagellin [Primorskyibacter sp. 2E233]|uniref:flagellin N-terminal helical domain-containing protein n=1 Tax=Primorskyibacter sp. 2E233 TaxID=3413431 RepID=UPI003BEF841C